MWVKKSNRSAWHSGYSAIVLYGLLGRFCRYRLVALVLLIDDQDTVVSNVEHRTVAVVVALAGLAVPVPDQADANVPGFMRCTGGAARLVWHEIGEFALQAEATADGDERIGADNAVRVVVDAGVDASFTAGWAV